MLENYKNGSVEGELLFELPSDGAGKERTAGDDGRRDEDDALQSEYKSESTSRTAVLILSSSHSFPLFSWTAGLALPFLVSWLCGDFTNLIG